MIHIIHTYYVARSQETRSVKNALRTSQDFSWFRVVCSNEFDEVGYVFEEVDNTTTLL
jgi:hypothetical protein